MKSKSFSRIAILLICALLTACNSSAFSIRQDDAATEYEYSTYDLNNGAAQVMGYSDESLFISSYTDNIGDDSATIADNDENEPQWIYDGLFEVLLLTSLDEANAYLQFPIELPTELLAFAKLENVIPFRRVTDEMAHGVLVNYIIEVDDSVWNDQYNQHESAKIKLVRAYVSEGASMVGSDLIGLEEDVHIDSSDQVMESSRIMIGEIEAKLTANNIPTLLGLADVSDDDYVVNAHIDWFRNNSIYQLSVLAPCDIIDLKMMVAIAESAK